LVRYPHWNRRLLRPIGYDRHHGPAARIDPVVLGAITVSRHKIGIPVRRWPYHGHPDDLPFPWFTNGFRLLSMRCGTERTQATQAHGRPQSCDRYLHALILMPWPPCHTQAGAVSVLIESEPGSSFLF